ncbi:MAG: hypothetical protein V1787_04750 [Candidatus Micrarchaeota archaeon]
MPIEEAFKEMVEGHKAKPSQVSALTDKYLGARVNTRSFSVHLAIPSEHEQAVRKKIRLLGSHAEVDSRWERDGVFLNITSKEKALIKSMEAAHALLKKAAQDRT